LGDIMLVAVLLLLLPMVSGWSTGSAVGLSVRTYRVRRRGAGAGCPDRMPRALMLAGPSELWSTVTDALEAARSSIVFDRGALRILDPNLAAFVGGAVGVIGTVESIMARRRAVRERLTCVYCDGAGTLTCGYCLGAARDAQGAPCANCNGLGKVACVSCQGSGNSVLLAEDRNLIRELAGLGTMQNELETEIDR
jgi:hypothetical protein